MFEEHSMSQRWIHKYCIAFMEPVGVGDTPLPYGMRTQLGSKVTCAETESCSGCVHGPSWPNFNLAVQKSLRRSPRDERAFLSNSCGRSCQALIETVRPHCLRSS